MSWPRALVIGINLTLFVYAVMDAIRSAQSNDLIFSGVAALVSIGLFAWSVKRLWELFPTHESRS